MKIWSGLEGLVDGDLSDPTIVKSMMHSLNTGEGILINGVRKRITKIKLINWESVTYEFK